MCVQWERVVEDVRKRSTGMRRSTSEERQDKRGEIEEHIFVSLINYDDFLFLFRQKVI